MFTPMQVRVILGLSKVEKSIEIVDYFDGRKKTVKRSYTTRDILHVLKRAYSDLREVDTDRLEQEVAKVIYSE